MLSRIISLKYLNFLFYPRTSLYWKWSCTYPEYGRRITSSDWLAEMRFAFLAARAYYQLVLSLLSWAPPGPFLLSSSPATYLCICPVLLYLRCRTPCIFLCWTSCCCYLPSALIYLDPSARLLIPPGSQQYIPVQCHQPACWGCIPLLHPDH